MNASNKLVVFSLYHGPNTNDLSEASKLWYFKEYESYFSTVQHLYLAGKVQQPIVNGNTSYYFSGSGNGLKDILLSPFRLYRFVKKNKPSMLLTYEQVWLWWAILWVRLFTGTPTYMMPITFPEQMYKVTGKSISGRLPIWLERIFIRWSYRSCTKVVTSYNVGNYINWQKENRIIRKKLLIVDMVPETVVLPSFMKKMEEVKSSGQAGNSAKVNLIYVGRLHHEKMTDHLIKALSIVRKSIPNAFLTIIGEGPDKDDLINLSKELGVSDAVSFLNYMPNAELPVYLCAANIFVSPSTGHSFREAAICGLPIVAYNIDWIKGFLVHRENFYAVDQIDAQALAEGITTLWQDQVLYQHLQSSIQQFAFKYWSPYQLRESLEALFGERKTA